MSASSPTLRMLPNATERLAKPLISVLESGKPGFTAVSLRIAPAIAEALTIAGQDNLRRGCPVNSNLTEVKPILQARSFAGLGARGRTPGRLASDRRQAIDRSWRGQCRSIDNAVPRCSKASTGRCGSRTATSDRLRIDDLGSAPRQLVHEFDHVLRAAGAVARLAVPQRDEEGLPEAHRQRAVQDPAVAAVMDADAPRRRPELLRHHEDRRRLFILNLLEAPLPAMVGVGEGDRLRQELLLGARQSQLHAHA